MKRTLYWRIHMSEPQHTSTAQTETSSHSTEGSQPDAQPTRVPITSEHILSLRMPTDINISPNAEQAAFVVWGYVSDEQKQRARIWVVDTVGGEARPLTRGPLLDTSPCWSPDSQQLAFISASKAN